MNTPTDAKILLSLKSAATLERPKTTDPRDGDADGFIYDGTPQERPAPARTSSPSPLPDLPKQPRPEPKKTPVSANIASDLSHNVKRVLEAAHQNAKMSDEEIAKAIHYSEVFEGTVEEFKSKVHAALDEAEFAIAFDHSRTIADGEKIVEGLGKRKRVLNLFEAGRGAGVDDKDVRKKWEENNFTELANSLTDEERPKYGYVDLFPGRLDPDHEFFEIGVGPTGESAVYGSSSIVLNEDWARERSTFTGFDSSRTDKKQIGTFQDPYRAALRSGEFEKKLIGGPEHVSASYAELQIFGDVPLDTTAVKKLRLDVSINLWEEEYHEEVRKKLEEAGDKFGSVPRVGKISDEMIKRRFGSLLSHAKEAEIPVEFVWKTKTTDWNGRDVILWESEEADLDDLFQEEGKVLEKKKPFVLPIQDHLTKVIPQKDFLVAEAEARSRISNELSHPVKKVLKEVHMNSFVDEDHLNFMIEDFNESYSFKDDFEPLTLEKYKKIVEEAFEEAEFAVAFDYDEKLSGDEDRAKKGKLANVVEGLAKKKKLLNLFETGYGSGSTSKVARKRWETKNFISYDAGKIDDSDRPKYGFVNFPTAGEEGEVDRGAIHPSGEAYHYGASSIVFKKDWIKGRATITGKDSSLTDYKTVGTPVSPHNAIFESPYFKGRFAGQVGPALSYTELQIWGDVPLNGESVEKFKLDVSDDFRSDKISPEDIIKRFGPLLELAKEEGIKVEFVYQKMVTYENGMEWKNWITEPADLLAFSKLRSGRSGRSGRERKKEKQDA